MARVSAEASASSALAVQQLAQEELERERAAMAASLAHAEAQASKLAEENARLQTESQVRLACRKSIPAKHLCHTCSRQSADRCRSRMQKQCLACRICIQIAALLPCFGAGPAHMSLHLS